MVEASTSEMGRVLRILAAPDCRLERADRRYGRSAANGTSPNRSSICGSGRSKPFQRRHLQLLGYHQGESGRAVLRMCATGSSSCQDIRRPRLRRYFLTFG